MENFLLATMEKQEIIMIVLISVALVLMVVMSIFSRKKQQKQAQEVMDSLKVGAKVLTIGRIVGEVVSVNNDNTVTIKTGNPESASTLIIDRMAIGTVLGKDGRPIDEKPSDKEKAKAENKTFEKSAKAEKIENEIKENLNK